MLYKYIYALLFIRELRDMAYKGRFAPRNPHKYNGDPSGIIYRSRWELICMQKFDAHPDIIEWSSEEIIIPYRSPIDGRVHRYFPDFHIKVRNKNGIVENILIEVKPAAQTTPPKAQTGKPTRRYITEVQTWGINSSKWQMARKYCEERGWKFQIITEKELGLKF